MGGILNGQVSGMGITGGGNFANLKAPESNSDSNTNPGGGAGLRFDFNIVDEFIKFSPEFFFQQKGSNDYIKNIDDLQFGQISLSYLGIYLPVSLYVPMSEESEYAYNGLFLQGKFYIDYSVAATQIKDSETRILQFASGGDKFDFGYSFEGGVIHNGLQLLIGYNQGIKNIDFIDSFGNSEKEISAKNSGVYLSLGYAHKFEDY